MQACWRLTMIYEMHLKNYDNVWQVENEFRRLKIKSYCYQIQTFHNLTKFLDTIKFGLGNDTEWMNDYWGNRLVRQIDGLYGWQQERYSGCSNKQKLRALVDEHFPNAQKDDSVIRIFDFTPEMFPKWEFDQPRRKLRLEEIEGTLVNDFQDQYGRTPVGNIGKVRSQHAVNQFAELFDIINK